jgi:hypothetical protein
MRKTIRNTIVSFAALAGVALMPSAAFAGTSYCIPPTTGQQTATQDANFTATTLTPQKPKTLGAQASFTAPAAAFSAGELGEAVWTISGKKFTLIGTGLDKFTGPGCNTITIQLTKEGKTALSAVQTGHTITLAVGTAFVTAGSHPKFFFAEAKATLKQ